MRKYPHRFHRSIGSSRPLCTPYGYVFSYTMGTTGHWFAGLIVILCAENAKYRARRTDQLWHGRKKNGWQTQTHWRAVWWSIVIRVWLRLWIRKPTESETFWAIRRTWCGPMVWLSQAPTAQLFCFARNSLNVFKIEDEIVYLCHESDPRLSSICGSHIAGQTFHILIFRADHKIINERNDSDEFVTFLVISSTFRFQKNKRDLLLIHGKRSKKNTVNRFHVQTKFLPRGNSCAQKNTNCTVYLGLQCERKLNPSFSPNLSVFYPLGSFYTYEISQRGKSPYQNYNILSI